MSTTLANTLGAFLIGVIVVSVSYGAVLVQTYLYYQNSESDSVVFKTTIGLLWILNTVHQVFVCHGLYTQVVLEYGDTLALAVLPWSIIAIVPITSAMNLAIRSIFCFRIWKLSDKTYILIIVIMLLSCAELATALGFIVIDRIQLRSILTLYHTNPIDLFVGVALSVVTDATVAISQTVLLWRSRVGMTRTDSILRILMLYSISTGLLSTFFALATVITWVTMIYNRIYLSFFCATPSLLFNALLATLNARTTLRGLISSPAVPILPPPTFPAYRAKLRLPENAETGSAMGVASDGGLVRRGLKMLPPLPQTGAGAP